MPKKIVGWIAKETSDDVISAVKYISSIFPRESTLDLVCAVRKRYMLWPFVWNFGLWAEGDNTSILADGYMNLVLRKICTWIYKWRIYLKDEYWM